MARSPGLTAAPPAFELRRQLLPERGADFRGLAQVGHDPNPVAASHRRQQPVADQGAELGDLGGHREFLFVDHRGAVHIAVV